MIFDVDLVLFSKSTSFALIFVGASGLIAESIAEARTPLWFRLVLDGRDFVGWRNVITAFASLTQ